MESCVTQWGKSSFTVQHRLLRGQTLAVEGFEKRVWTVRPGSDSSKAVSQAIPPEVIAKFS